MDLEIRIVNFKKFKGRSDVEHNTWFRLSNRFLEDPTFYPFTLEEKFVWLYFLSLSSQLNDEIVPIFYEHVKRHTGIVRDVVDSAIKKLIEINCIEKLRARAVRRRNVYVTDTCSTDIQDRQNRTKQTEQCSYDFEMAFCNYPVAVKGPHCEKRFHSQIKSEEDFGKLMSAIINYRTFLARPESSWRSPKQSFSAFLGTESSGFFWHDFVDFKQSDLAAKAPNRADLSLIQFDGGPDDKL